MPAHLGRISSALAPARFDRIDGGQVAFEVAFVCAELAWYGGFCM
jgi:hypothetical protein